MWSLGTKNTQIINFNHDQLIYNYQNDQKQSPKTSSDSINLKKAMKKTLQELIYIIKEYQPVSKYIEMKQLKSSSNLHLKRYKQCIYYGEIIQKFDDNAMINVREGYGIMLYTNGRIYQGQWHNNFKQGKGYENFQNLSIYSGDYVKGKPEGYGKYQWENGEVYEGEWKNGLKNGSGIWRGSKGDSYIGEWKSGIADGYGVHTWINGNRYQGEFKACLKHGEGVDKFANGDTYKGTYQNGKPHGYGEYYWNNGSSYKGDFQNGLRSGKGVWKKDKDNISDMYQGDFVDQKRQGYGIFTWANGSKYIGNFKNEVRQGYGQMFWIDGNVYKGQWKNGEQVYEDLPYESQDISLQLGKEVYTDGFSKMNPEESYEFQQFLQPNYPQIIQQKKFRARGIHSRIKNTKNDRSTSKIQGGFMIAKNFATQAVANSGGSYPLKLNKRSSMFSSKGEGFSNSRPKIRHSQTTFQKKGMSSSLYNYNHNRQAVKSSKNIPRHMDWTVGHEGQSGHYRQDSKIKPRVIKSSNGVRQVYKKDSILEDMSLSRQAILNDEEDVKWFTRSKNKSQYF